VGQKTLGGGYKHVKEMRVGWGVWSCAIGGVGNGRGKRSYMCMIKGVWESVGLGPYIHPKGWGLVRKTNGWCVVH